MSLEDLGIIGHESRTLHIDGDIILYQPCCIFNEDDDMSRRSIIKHVNNKIDKMMTNSGCDRFIFFMTTKFNFRDYLVDDYKYNRVDTERPVNLVWAKRWATKDLAAYYKKYLEADDLLGMYQTENTVIWSLDKDLRQVPGKHLDDETGKVVQVTEDGRMAINSYVTDSGNAKEKIYFDGFVGLCFQMLTGDSTDWIVGCGKRVTQTYKTGPKAGQEYLSRKGVGPKKAYKLVLNAVMYRGSKTVQEAALGAVVEEYYKLFKGDWQKQLETQANLLYMVRWGEGNLIKRWTFDGRDEYFDIEKGVIITKEVFINDYKEAIT